MTRETAGAANLVVRDGDRLRGHNTDVDGVRAGLRALIGAGEDKWPQGAVVLGAGGGARAVVAVLIGSAVQHIAVFNRHLHRAEAVVAQFAATARRWSSAPALARDLHGGRSGEAQLLVNSQRHRRGGRSRRHSRGAAAATACSCWTWSSTTPGTPLMRDAQARGGTVANGQASFLAASAETFQLLTGQEPRPR